MRVHKVRAKSKYRRDSVERQGRGRIWKKESAHGPYREGVCLETTTQASNNPGTVMRKVARVRLTNGSEVIAYVPEKSEVQRDSIVLVRGGRMREMPGVSYQIVRGSIHEKKKLALLKVSQAVSHRYFASVTAKTTTVQTTKKAFRKKALQKDQEDILSQELIEEVANSGPDVNALCEKYKLKREELGRLTGFSLRALAEWSAGKLPSQPAKRRLQEVRRLLDELAKIVKPERIPEWLHRPNPTFAPLTPLQVIELGEIDRLWAMVHDLESGQPT